MKAALRISQGCFLRCSERNGTVFRFLKTIGFENMRQLSAAGQIQLAQNACLLVGDGFAAFVSGASSAEQINWACGVTPRAVSRIVGMSTEKLLLNR